MVGQRKQVGVLVRRVWEVSMTMAAITLLLYQVSFNLQVYLDKPTIFVVSLEPITVFRLPPLSICPYPPFEPRALTSMGLNHSILYNQFEMNYNTLLGIPDNLTAGELWQRAGWSLGHIIRTVFLDGKAVHYKPSDLLTSLWRRSYSPLGPCLTLAAPAGTTEILILLNKVPYVKPCMIPNENGELDQYRRFPGQCERVSVTCNSSCGLEDAIFYRFLHYNKMHIYFHEAVVYAEHQPATKEDTQKYSDQLFDGNYVLNALSNTQSIKSHPQLIDTTLIKGPCISSQSYTHAHCFQHQFTDKILQKLGCYPLFPSHFGKSSKHACASPEVLENLFWAEFKSKLKCPQRCKRQRWLHDITTSSNQDFTIIIKAISTDLRREVELDTYPLARFFSDVGGSLGLFLGVSVFSFLEFLIKDTRRFCALKGNMLTKREKRHTAAVTKYATLTVLSIVMGAHCLEALRAYLTQPRLAAVSLRTMAAGDEDDDTATLVARRLATRALDCRPEETRHEECRMQCLLEVAAGEVASVVPFIRLEGLPACQRAPLSLPSYVYLVPPELVLAATQSQTVDKCQAQCAHLPHTVTPGEGLVMRVDNSYYSTDILQLICNIGGIIGLYLGYSVCDILNYFHSLVITQEGFVSDGLIKERLSKVLRVIKITSILFGVILGLWQLHTFLVRHKLSSSTKQTPRTSGSEHLALTVCRWPPLSLHHLARQLRLNISETHLLRLPKDERQAELLKVLETLPGNWSLSLDELWSRAAWNITDVLEGFEAITKEREILNIFCSDLPICQDLWKPVMTPLNRCYTFNATYGNSDIIEVTLVFPESLEKTNVLGESPQIYFTVNPSQEPALMADMVPKTAYMTIVATHHVATYRRLDQQESGKSVGNTSHSSCIHKCISEAASTHLQCRLPYVTWRLDLDPCDQIQYAAIHRFFKGLEGIGSWNNVGASENASHDLLYLRDKCYKECRHLQQTFHAITVEKSLDKYPTVVVRFSEDKVVVSEEDRHPVSSLVSDLGGIASTTAGFSLLFLLREFVPRALMPKQPLT